MEAVAAPQSADKQLWLIGGTAESKTLAQALVDQAMPTVVTVTTEAARRLYPQHPLLQVRVGRLSPTDFDDFLQREQVVGILDASHPFATEISKGAIAVSQRHLVPYLRYERPRMPSSEGDIHTVPDLDTLFKHPWLDQQRVLIILGFRHLAAFAPWHAHAALHARILPSATALTAAYQAGFSAHRLVALRPPVSPAVEAALWQQWRITTVVAKASGMAGGEAVKRQLAQTLGVRLILLTRPMVPYPNMTGNMDEAIAFCQDISGFT
ncbi:MAG: cobalt-precorrin-6A reductase [Cyanobacteria bacterium J06632_22]